MKTKTELIEQSKKYFESHTGQDTFIATSDGMFFHKENRDAAKDHANKNDLEIHNITRKEVMQPAEKEKTAEEKEKGNLTKEEIIAELQDKGIEHDPKAKKVNLMQALINADEPQNYES